MIVSDISFLTASKLQITSGIWSFMVKCDGYIGVLYMNRKLYEGVVVQSKKFVNGIFEDGKLLVGDYEENYIGHFSKGERQNDYTRADKKYVIVSFWEMNYQIVTGSNITSYENKFVAKELNEDGSYNEYGEEIHFTTSGMFRGSIHESDIHIIKVMKKVFI
jgi:hypothetical protein